MRPITTRAALLATLGVVVAVSACGLRGRRPAPDRSKGTIITYEEIQETGATNVWEALDRTVKYTQFTTGNSGEPQRIRRRGASTIALFEDIPILVDHVRVLDVRMLAEMPSSEIDHIQVLNGIDATTYYGTNATDGVILIFTRHY